LGGPGPFDTSRVVITHNYIHPRLSRSGKIGKEIDSALLFNVTADPSETHDLAAEFPELVAEMRAKLASYRSKRGPQQKFWMQYHLIDVWPKTFVSGDCSLDPSIRPSDCHFTHPWVADSEDPWLGAVIDGNEYADGQLRSIVIKVAIGALLFVVILVRYVFCPSSSSKRVRDLNMGAKKKKN
jgi:hypothetical protein